MGKMLDSVKRSIPGQGTSRGKTWLLLGIPAAATPVALFLIPILFVFVISGVVTTVSGGLGAALGEKSSQRQGCWSGTGGGGGVAVSASQREYIRTVVGVAKSLDINKNGMIVAVMVMLQETGIRNMANDGSNPGGANYPSPGASYWMSVTKKSLQYPHDGVGHNADSIGLFQQRPSMGWGSMGGSTGKSDPDKVVQRLLNPTWEVQAFFGGSRTPPANSGLLDVPGWKTLPPTVAAQKVQGSAFPQAYAKWQSRATQLVERNLDAPPVPLIAPGGGGNGDDGTANGEMVGSSGGCGSAGGISATGTVKAIIAAGKEMLGTPYSWGGGALTGPSEGFGAGAGIVGFDCSSLVRYMVYQGTGGKDGGMILPRVAQAQYTATSGHRVKVQDLQPGDLMFWGTPGSLHHVAMYIGNGKMIEAPHTGASVRIVPIRTGGDYHGATRLEIHKNET